MKTRKLVLLSISLFVVLSLFILPMFITSVGTRADNICNVDTSSAHTYTTEDHHEIYYYKIKSVKNREYDSTLVAVAYKGIEEGFETNPDIEKTITIPETFNNASCKVACILKGGFRYSPFEEINLPKTVIEMQEESFAYCQNLKKFIIPYQITQIQPSTFLDCVKLARVYYSDETGAKKLNNDKIEIIGNHAFDSCRSLQTFVCPSFCTLFEQSCFQRCSSLRKFYFAPYAKRLVSGSSETYEINYITVQSYAFADCSNLLQVYFEDNMSKIYPYAFAGSNNDLKIYYAIYYDDTKDTTTLDINYLCSDLTKPKYWRKKHTQDQDKGQDDAYYQLEETEIIRQSVAFPGLSFNIVSDNIYLDCGKKTLKLWPKTGDNTEKYAVITGWEPEEIELNEEIEGYYKSITDSEGNIIIGELTIPSYVDSGGVMYPVRVIDSQAFENHSDEITSVKFTENLIQIKSNAFCHDVNIETLDFTEANNLLEISEKVFHSGVSGSNNTNSKVTEIVLPNSLLYIGQYAFCNFTKCNYLSFKTDDSQASNLKVIGSYAFANIGCNVNTGTDARECDIHVELPYSLNDSDASSATLNGGDNSVAVQKYAFAGTNTNKTAIVSIKMEECPNNHDSTCSIYTSFSSDCFTNDSNLLRFEANDNLYRLAPKIFNGCANLKEVFLTTDHFKGPHNETKYAWGGEFTAVGAAQYYDSSIFEGATTRDLTIYIDGSEEDLVHLNSISNDTDFSGIWNVETENSYGLESSTGLHVHTRTCIPTYYNVDKQNQNSVYYWYLGSNGINTLTTTRPELEDYNKGIITFIKNSDGGSYDTYTIGHYYVNAQYAKTEIDLTDSSLGILNGRITRIGDEAFAADKVSNGDTNHSKAPGVYFVLPTTIESIGERAFYRYSYNNGNSIYGVKIITFKNDSGVEIIPDGSPNNTTYASYKNSNNPGYCCLPKGVSYIGRSAFHNNYFGQIDISSTMAGTKNQIGNSAFYSEGKNIQKIVIGSSLEPNNLFSVSVNSGLYFDGLDLILVYQSQKHSDDTSTLILSDMTTAVGMNACANTDYTKIILNSQLSYIYGGAFQNNTSLTEVVIPNANSLKYIGGITSNKYKNEDVFYDKSYPLDNINYRNLASNLMESFESSGSAFANCGNLTTFDFTKLTNLRKIGYWSFKDCSSLSNMTGNNSYSFYSYKNSINGNTIERYGLEPIESEPLNSGVLDLSKCVSLSSIEREAFIGCSGIQYAILPKSNENDGGFYFGRDETPLWRSAYKTLDSSHKRTVFDASGMKILVGDTAIKAYSDEPFGRSENELNEVKKHYDEKCFEGNTAYYYAESFEDVNFTSSASSKVKFWTLYNGKYILFESLDDAKAFFSNGDDTYVENGSNYNFKSDYVYRDDKGKVLYEINDIESYVNPENIETKNYLPGDLVTFDDGTVNKVYRCKVATNNLTEINDEYWEEVSTARPYEQKSYSVNDLVIYNNKLYKCRVAIVTGEVFTPGKWIEILVNAEYVADGKNYNLNDVVIYHGEFYRCIIAHTSIDSGNGEIDDSKWNKIIAIEEYDPEKAYSIGNIVSYNGFKCICKTATSGSAIEPKEFDAADWFPLLDYPQYVSGTNYKKGNVVRDGYKIYICVDGDDEHPVTESPKTSPNSNATLKWVNINYMRNHTGSTEFDQGDIMLRNGEVYIVKIEGPNANSFGNWWSKNNRLEKVSTDKIDGFGQGKSTTYPRAKTYHKNDIIVMNPLNSQNHFVYICCYKGEEGLSVAANQAFDSKYWLEVASIYNTESKLYPAGSIVTYTKKDANNNDIYTLTYKCITPYQSGTIIGNFNESRWQYLYGSYSSRYSYSADDYVENDYKLYQCKNGTNGSINNPVDFDDLYWHEVGTDLYSELEDYDSSRIYNPGDLIELSGGLLYRCITKTDGTIEDPEPFDSAKWEAIQKLVPYSSSVKYNAGVYTSYNGIIYKCNSTFDDDDVGLFNPNKWDAVNFVKADTYASGKLTIFNNIIYGCTNFTNAYSTFDNNCWQTLSSYNLYVPGDSYSTGDIVKNNSKEYQCIEDFTGNSNVTDLSNDSHWMEIINAPAYSSSTQYVVGNLVIYNNTIYRCIAATMGDFSKTSWETPAIYRSSKGYAAGEFAILDGKMYRAKTTINQNESFDSNKWEEVIIPTGYCEPYSHFLGDRVAYNDVVYECTETSITSPETFNPNHWRQISPSIFSSLNTYSVGDLVIYNNTLYQCETAVSSAGSFSGDTNWNEIGKVGKTPDYDDKGVYDAGDLVKFNEHQYVCHTKITTGEYFNPGRWTELSECIDYENGTYSKGAIVYYLNNYYICKADSTSSDPGGDNSGWVLVKPASEEYGVYNFKISSYQTHSYENDGDFIFNAEFEGDTSTEATSSVTLYEESHGKWQKWDGDSFEDLTMTTVNNEKYYTIANLPYSTEVSYDKANCILTIGTGENEQQYKYLIAITDPNFDVSQYNIDVDFNLNQQYVGGGFSITPIVNISKKSFTIKWVDYDNSVLEIDYNVPYGNIPQFRDGSNPTRSPDIANHYTFSHWDNTVVAATANATYKAVYDEELNKYQVTWLSGDIERYNSTKLYSQNEYVIFNNLVYKCKQDFVDGNVGEFNVDLWDLVTEPSGLVLEVDNTEYSYNPSYNGNVPVKTAVSTDQYGQYEFVGWVNIDNPNANPIPTNGFASAGEVVGGNVIYLAQFQGVANTERRNDIVLHNGDHGIWQIQSGNGYENITMTNGSYTISNILYSTIITVTDVTDEPNEPAYYYNVDIGSDNNAIHLRYYLEKDSDGVRRYISDLGIITGDIVGVGKDLYPIDDFYTIEHKVTWLEYDESISDYVVVYEATFTHGTTLSYDGDDPSKEDDASYVYTFEGWVTWANKDNDEVNPITSLDLNLQGISVLEDMVYVARYSKEVNSTEYNIVWVYWEDNVLKSETTKVAAGNMPTHADPADRNEGLFAYTFDSWSPAISVALGDATYTAVYTKTLRTDIYTIIWKNYDGSILATDYVEENDIPSYIGEEHPDRENPIREVDPLNPQYRYEFAGWSPTITAATGEEKTIEYVAQFNAIARTNFTIKWLNWDNDYEHPLEALTNQNNDNAEYPGQTLPVKPQDAQYTYTFTGWSNVYLLNGDLIKVPQYSSNLRSYTVTWVLINISDYDTESTYKQGDCIKYNNSAYTCKNDFNDAAGAFDSSKWTLIGNLTQVDNDNALVLEIDTNVPYGDMPVFNGSTPVPNKPQDAQYTYQFNGGWSPDVSIVTGDVVYEAEYEATIRYYTVTWDLDNGDADDTTNVVYGGTPTHSKPTKAADQNYEYDFVGWKTPFDAHVTKTYSAGSLVVYNDTTYICIQDMGNSVHTVNESDYWKEVTYNTSYQYEQDHNYSIGDTIKVGNEVYVCIEAYHSSANEGFDATNWCGIIVSTSHLRPIYGDVTIVAVYKSTAIQSGNS